MGCSGLTSHPRIGSSEFRPPFDVYAHDERFIVSRAAAASPAVLISVGSSFAVGEYQNARAGASVTGRSSRETDSETDARPSIKRLTCSNRDQPISSSVLALPIP